MKAIEWIKSKKYHWSDERNRIMYGRLNNIGAGIIAIGAIIAVCLVYFVGDNSNPVSVLASAYAIGFTFIGASIGIWYVDHRK